MDGEHKPTEKKHRHVTHNKTTEMVSDGDETAPPPITLRGTYTFVTEHTGSRSMCIWAVQVPRGAAPRRSRAPSLWLDQEASAHDSRTKHEQLAFFGWSGALPPALLDERFRKRSCRPRIAQICSTHILQKTPLCGLTCRTRYGYVVLV